MPEPEHLLAELAALCERFAVPETWRSLTLSRFEEGLSRYGYGNHLALNAEDLRRETREEAADLLAFVLFIPWSRAYHSMLYRKRGKMKGLPLTPSEAIDNAVSAEVVEAVLEALCAIEAEEADSYADP